MQRLTLSGEIDAVSNLSRVLRRSKNTRRLLFRGQNVDKPLLPTIARVAQEKSIPYDKLTQIEKGMLARFERESIPFLRDRRPATGWEWLSVAQHQGLPTRLLDWTANSLAGLWFAVAADPPDGQDAVLWVLDVSAANEKAPAPSENVFDLRRTFVFQPFHIEQRIVAQAAWFSAHGYSQKKRRFVPLDENSRFKESLRKYSIPRRRLDSLRRELRLMGITQASMFPDLSGLCADIQAESVGSWRQLGTI